MKLDSGEFYLQSVLSGGKHNVRHNYTKPSGFNGIIVAQIMVFMTLWTD